MLRADTEEKLNIITHRNDGRRRSLLLDEDFSYTDKEPGDSASGSDDSPHLRNRMHATNRAAGSSSAPSSRSSSTNSIYDDDDEELSHDQTYRAIRDIERKFLSQNRLKKRAGSLKQKRDKDAKVDLALTKAKVEQLQQGHIPQDLQDAYRSKFSDIHFYSKSTTIFDAESFKNSEFFGIYVLFWLGTAFLMLTNLVHSYFDSEVPFHQKPVMRLLRKDLLKIGLTDSMMYLTLYAPYLVQLGCLHRWFKWNTVGWVIHSVIEFSHFVFWLKFAAYEQFSWIGRVFLCLHGCVFLMKMHSYGFYNGYLWNTLQELKFSRRYLQKLESGTVEPPTNYQRDALIRTLNNSVTFCQFELEVQSKASLLIDPTLTAATGEATVNERLLENLDRTALDTKVNFPENITLFNFFEFSMYPAVVYTLNFTRTARIRWRYVAEKTVGIFGIIFLMIMVAENMMYPICIKAINMRTLPPHERFRQYPFVLLDMIPPFLMEYLFTFFLIWDAILNLIAELSRFADRDFYGPWWSCLDWSEYARIWNRPVHKFLLRHVYHSSLSALNLNKVQSTLMTFVISSIVHELVMYVIFNKLRGYLLLLQMSQLPLIALSNTRFMKNKKVLGNVICWFGFISGPSMICTLYLMF